MLFDEEKIRKRKEKNNDLSNQLINQKEDLKFLKKMRNKNTVGAYYDERFMKNFEDEEKKEKKNFTMVNTGSVNDVTLDYLKNQFMKKKEDTMVLPKRHANMHINQTFTLQIDYKKKDLELFADNFDNEDEDEEIYLENLLEGDSDNDSVDEEEDDEFFQFKEEEYNNEEKLSKIKKNVSMETFSSTYMKTLEEDKSSTKDNVIDQINDVKDYYEDEIIQYYSDNVMIKNDKYVSIGRNKNYEIPLVCYTIWHNKNLPNFMEKNWKSLQKNNPEITFYLYDEADCRDFIQKNFDKEVVDAYDKLAPSSYKSDLWRFCVLYVNGGIYLDIKYNCVNGFKLINICNKEHFCMDRINHKNEKWWNNNEQGIYTAVITCKSRNKILRQCINSIVENTESYYYGKNALYPTGPGLLGKKFFGENFNIHLMEDIKLFHSSDTVIYNNTKVLEMYSEYRDEQKQYQSNLHYSLLWEQKNIYNMKFNVLNKITIKKKENLPNVLCIFHIGSYHVFIKMKDYINNLISAQYDEYNLIMYFNIIETIQKEHFASIKKMYPNVNYVISENYGFDVGSFFHILEIVKQRKESYHYLIKLHTKTDNEKRDNLLMPILGSINIIRKTIEEFNKSSNVGIIAAKNGRCIDAHVDFIRNQSYLQQLVEWYFQEKTRISKQPYVSGTIFWIKFEIIDKLFMNINLSNIYNSFNNVHTFDWNWYYYANNKYIKDVTLNKNNLYAHYCEKGKNMNLSGNLYHANKYSTKTFHLRDGMIEHAYERFFCYGSHRLGYQILFVK